MKMDLLNQRTVLLLGLLFIIGGTQSLVALFSPLELDTYIIRPSLFLFSGLITLFASFLSSVGNQRKSLYLFTGMLLSSLWLVFLLLDSQIIPYTMSQVWPVVVILSGVILLFVAIIRYRYLPISLLLSAIVLICMGVLFLLFSLNIVVESFTEFASRWWPMLFILFGLFLILLFIYMKHHEKEKWINDSYDDEDIS